MKTKKLPRPQDQPPRPRAPRPDAILISRHLLEGIIKTAHGQCFSAMREVHGRKTDPQLRLRKAYKDFFEVVKTLSAIEATINEARHFTAFRN